MHIILKIISVRISIINSHLECRLCSKVLLTSSLRNAWPTPHTLSASLADVTSSELTSATHQQNMSKDVFKPEASGKKPLRSWLPSNVALGLPLPQATCSLSLVVVRRRDEAGQSARETRQLCDICAKRHYSGVTVTQ